MNSSKPIATSDLNILTFTSITFNLLVSLPVNGYSVWLMASGAGGSLEAEFLPLNLAVFEILFCLLSVSRYLRVFFPSVKIMSLFSKSFLWSGRPILQCCICMEQFVAVVHPVLFLRYKSLRYKAAFAGLAWTVIIGFSLFYLLFHSLSSYVFVCECLTLMSVMVFCYFSVLWALKRPQPGEGKRVRANNLKRRAFLTILGIVVSFVGTYFLWCVAILSNLCTWNSHGRRVFTKICTFITFLCGFVQPVNYLQRTGKCPCSKTV